MRIDCLILLGLASLLSACVSVVPTVAPPETVIAEPPVVPNGAVLLACEDAQRCKQMSEAACIERGHYYVLSKDATAWVIRCGTKPIPWLMPNGKDIAYELTDCDDAISCSELAMASCVNHRRVFIRPEDNSAGKWMFECLQGLVSP